MLPSQIMKLADLTYKARTHYSAELSEEGINAMAKIELMLGLIAENKKWSFSDVDSLIYLLPNDASDYLPCFVRDTVALAAKHELEMNIHHRDSNKVNV